MSSLSLFAVPFRKLNEMDEMRILKQEDKLRERLDRNCKFFEKYISRNEENREAFMNKDENKQNNNTLKPSNSSTSLASPNKNNNLVDTSMENKTNASFQNIKSSSDSLDDSESSDDEHASENENNYEVETFHLNPEQRRQVNIINRLREREKRELNNIIDLKQKFALERLEAVEALKKKKELHTRQRAKEERQAKKMSRHLARLEKKRNIKHQELEENAKLRLETLMNHVHMEQLKAAKEKGIIKDWKEISVSKRKLSRKQRLIHLSQHEELEMKRNRIFHKLENQRNKTTRHYYLKQKKEIETLEKDILDKAAERNQAIAAKFPLKTKYKKSCENILDKIRRHELLEEKRVLSLQKKRPLFEIVQKKFESNLHSLSSNSDDSSTISEESKNFEEIDISEQVDINTAASPLPPFISPQKQKLRKWEEIEEARYKNLSEKLKQTNLYILEKLGKVQAQKC